MSSGSGIHPIDLINKLNFFSFLLSFSNSSHFHFSLPADPPAHPGPTSARRIPGGTIPELSLALSPLGGLQWEQQRKFRDEGIVNNQQGAPVASSGNLNKAGIGEHTGEEEEDN